LDPDDQTFVVSMRVNFTSYASSAVGDYDLIRKGQASDGQDWKIEVMEDGRARCFANGSSGHKSLPSAKPLSTGVWHTIVCTFSTSSLTIIVDAGTPKKQSA